MIANTPDVDKIFVGIYELYNIVENYHTPATTIYYQVDGNKINANFYNGSVNSDDIITSFIITPDTFKIEHSTTNIYKSMTWHNNTKKWTYCTAINGEEKDYNSDTNIKIYFELPLLFDEIFFNTFTSIISKHTVAVYYEDGYRDGYESGYAVGYIAGIAITNDANATSDTIVAGYSAWVSGTKVEGTILNGEEMRF